MTEEDSEGPQVRGILLQNCSVSLEPERIASDGSG
jgi:hypothetical protein